MSDHPAPVPASAPAASTDVNDFNRHVKGYIKIGLVQIVFTIVTIAVSYFPFHSHMPRIILTLLAATANAILVAGISMHLKDEKQMIWKFLIFTGIFTFVLFFLTWLAHADPIMGTVHSHH